MAQDSIPAFSGVRVLVGSIGSGSVNISRPRNVIAAEAEPQVFLLTMSYRTDNGLGERLVASTTKTHRRRDWLSDAVRN